MKLPVERLAGSADNQGRMVVLGVVLYLAAAAAFYVYAVKTALVGESNAPTLLLLVNNEAEQQDRRAA